MKGYWLILGTEISDPEAQAEYGRLWAPVAERYRARVNPLDLPPVLKEARDAPRVVVVEFPSYEAAVACYEDPAYQAARAVGAKAAKRELLILRGMLG